LKKFVIIVAAGTGKRFSSKLPKQFELLCGRPMLMHPIEAFYESEAGISIVVVIPKEYMSLWAELSQEYNFRIPHRVIEGGPERFHSVKNGLSHIDDEGLVAIHDGARPLVSCELIRECFPPGREIRRCGSGDWY
jgi:2-C-methyl-D-erythritol 4-phosphate cytidylyltransferase